MGRYNRADLNDVQRLNLDVNEGEAGPLLRFWLNEFPQNPIDLPIRSLVDAAIESIQVTPFIGTHAGSISARYILLLLHQ